MEILKDMFRQMSEGYEIAAKIGEPIRTGTLAAIEMTKIADIQVVEPGVPVYVPTSADIREGHVWNVDPTTGKMIVEKVDPIGDTTLNFKLLQSPLRRVVLPALMNSPNAEALLASNRAIIAREMDKVELRKLISGLFDGADRADGGAPDNVSITNIVPESNEDLFQVIGRMKATAEDFCDDNYILLAGSAVYNKIQFFDRDNAAVNNYSTGLLEWLDKVNIELVKMSGAVEYEDDGEALKIMDPNRLILLGKRSYVSEGLPIKFIRRKCQPYASANFSVDALQRGYLKVQMPMKADISATEEYIWSFGLAGFESVIYSITNPKAIVTSADLSGNY